MNTRDFTTAILLCAGEGKRFNHPLPKQFHRLSGKKIYLYALETFLASPCIHAIVIVAPSAFHQDILDDLRAHQNKPIILASGKSSRQLSTLSGLKACPENTTHVLVHDGVRPFVTHAIIEENILLAKQHGSCDTCIPSYDTIVHSADQAFISTIPQRSMYLRGQTPQTFSYELLLRAHQEAQQASIIEATDDCQLVLRLSRSIPIAQGCDENIKITTEYDLLLAEQILRLKLMRPPELIQESILNKRYVIVGANGGIGSALIRALTNKGALCIPLTKKDCNNSNPHQIKTVFETLFNTYGPLDGLINVAGCLTRAPLSILSEKDIQQHIDSNFLAMVLACKYCQLKHNAHIVNFSSSSYTRGRPTYIMYSAMKSAVVNFTQGLAMERPDLNINCIVPSRTHTSMREKNFPGEDINELLDKETVADEVVKILGSIKMTGMTVEIKKK